MAERVVVGNPFENQIGTVAPTASPVDIYVRPVVERSSLAALAETLSNIERKATPALARMEQRAAEREFKEGQRLYEENRIAIGDAVKKGIIAEGESPYVRKGYRVSQMTTMATRYADELERALNTKKLYTSGDPQKIEEFVRTFQQDFISRNGMAEFSPSEVSEFFGQPANKANEAFRQSWQKKHVAWQAAAAYQAFETEVATTVSTLFTPDQTPEERQAAMVQLQGYLEGRAGMMATDGLDNDKVINTILAGVGIAVETTGDDDILDVFSATKFGTDYAAKSLKVQGKILDIRSKALAIQERRRAAEEKQTEAAMSRVRAFAQSGLLQYESEPTLENLAVVENSIQTLLATGDEKNVEEALKMRKWMKDLDTEWDAALKTPQSFLEIQAKIATARSDTEARAILGTAADAGLIDKNDLKSLMSEWRSNYDPTSDDKYGLKFYTTTSPEGQYANSVYQAFRQDPDSYDVELMNNATMARAKFEVAMRQRAQIYFQTNNVPMPIEERSRAAMEIYKNLIVALQEPQNPN